MCSLDRRMRLVILNLFAVSRKEHRNINKYIGCNPFSGRLTRSTRQMRGHKTVWPNYRRLSTSTIVLCDEKILREMMLKLNDVCDCDEQLSLIIWVCAFLLFFGEKKKK